jgi:putative exosortase-associated protein (TIGR04073 family)
MRNAVTLLALAAALAFTGCAGPERKLGRGLNNVTEIMRMGEMRRSIEQTALWDGPDSAFSTGLLRGFNRSVARTAVGAYEVVTFPIPSYDPLFAPKFRLYPDSSIRNKHKNWGGQALLPGKVYPESFRPGLLSDQMFSTDTSLGFSGGDVAPMFPGSRFRVFDN